jgi:hypothetical protein
MLSVTPTGRRFPNLYAQEVEDEARHAKMLTATRIAGNIALLLGMAHRG